MTQPIPAGRNRAAFFDLDLTLTGKDCFRGFLKTLYFSKLTRLIFLPGLLYYIFLRKVRIISLRTFKEKSLVVLKGASRAKIQTLGTLFFKDWIRFQLRRGAVHKIKQHQQQGDLIFIISGSPDIYVHAVCDFLGCTDYACTRLEYDNLTFTGRIDGPDCLGMAKKELIYGLADTYGVDLGASIAYSDHESDLPFFETIGKKVAVSPTPRLEEIARNRGWEVCQW